MFALIVFAIISSIDGFGAALAVADAGALAALAALALGAGVACGFLSSSHPAATLTTAPKTTTAITLLMDPSSLFVRLRPGILRTIAPRGSTS
jgi:hypothetical protein